MSMLYVTSTNNNHNNLNHNQSLISTSKYHSNICNDSVSQVMLSTANVLIQDSKGKWHKCRALLNSGSQPNFISQNLLEALVGQAYQLI